MRKTPEAGRRRSQVGSSTQDIGIQNVNFPRPDPQDSIEALSLLASLKRYHAAGKAVFDLEYAVKKAPEAYQSAQSNGLVPYCSRAALSRLSDTPPPGY